MPKNAMFLFGNVVFNAIICFIRQTGSHHAKECETYTLSLLVETAGFLEVLKEDLGPYDPV